MKQYAMIFFACLPLVMQAQTDEFRKSYDEFRRQAVQNYRDFRDEANEKYAEFVKQTWVEYRALPVIPKPKDKTVPPVVMPKEDEGKPLEDNNMLIKNIVTTPKTEFYIILLYRVNGQKVG